MNSCGRIDYAKTGRGRNLRGGASRRPNAKLIVEPRTAPQFVGKKMGRQQPQFRRASGERRHSLKGNIAPFVRCAVLPDLKRYDVRGSRAVQ